MAFATNPYYSVITINRLLVAGSLTDFVFYIDDLPADAYASIHASGKDIRFSDVGGTTELAFDLRSIDTAGGNCSIMVKVPSVSNISDPEIRIWYGDHTLSLYSASDPYGRNAVYTGFDIVQSLDEELAGAAGGAGPAVYIDRTGSGYDGLDYVATVDKNGVVGNGQGFDGASDYIRLTSAWTASLPCSLVCWFRRDTGGVSHTIFCSDTWSAAGGAYRGITAQIIGSDLIRLSYGDGGGRATAFRRSKDAFTPVPGTWYHFGGILRGQTDMSIIINGADAGGSYSGGGGVAIANSAQAPTIGAYEDATEVYDGNLDEIWVTNGDIGIDYISTLYQNQLAGFGTFYTVGAKITVPSGATFLPKISWF